MSDRTCPDATREYVEELTRQRDALLEAARDIHEILEDEYDGAPDSGNRHWGRAMVALAAAIALCKKETP